MRELRVCQDETTSFIRNYYANLQQLSISEDEVIELAREIGRRVTEDDHCLVT
jgi:hypothetical protein